MNRLFQAFLLLLFLFANHTALALLKESGENRTLNSDLRMALTPGHDTTGTLSQKVNYDGTAPHRQTTRNGTSLIDTTTHSPTGNCTLAHGTAMGSRHACHLNPDGVVHQASFDYDYSPVRVTTQNNNVRGFAQPHSTTTSGYHHKYHYDEDEDSDSNDTLAPKSGPADFMDEAQAILNKRKADVLPGAVDNTVAMAQVNAQQARKAAEAL